MSAPMSPRPRKGRGAVNNPDSRYASVSREAVDDGWGNDGPENPGSMEQSPAPPLQTTLTEDASRTIITYNKSPDVGFDRSINPYRGCEHGCVYCFARPTHAWLDLSPGLDFESRLFYKPRAAELLKEELCKPGYRCAPITVGINTDAYQPVERRLQLTRTLLEVLAAAQHPFVLVTKSALVERDLDILTEAACRGQAGVAVSLTTLNPDIARRMEPRAAAPKRRLETIRRLAKAGVPVTVLVAPVIPVLTDGELETILEQARSAGAQSAGYILLRLPHELKTVFRSWLQQHEPLKAEHVMNRLRDCRGGKDNDFRFGHRMRGVGQFADLLEKRFALAIKKLGYEPMPVLDCAHFTPPGPQLNLF